MNQEKDNLRAQTRTYFMFCTLRQGVKKLLSSWRHLLGFALALVLLTGLTEIYTSLAPALLSGFLHTLSVPVVLFAAVLGIYALGSVKGGRRYYNDFVRTGFVNAAGEAPVLLQRTVKNGITTLTFYSRGLTALVWNEQIDALQSALNLSIAEIRPGKDHCTVTVKAVPANTNLGTLIPWSDRYINLDNDADFILGRSLTGDVRIDIDKQPMALIGGSTGSGKTVLAFTLLVQALKRNATVFVYDGKGLDFWELAAMDAHIVTEAPKLLAVLNDIVDRLHSRIEVFREAGAHSFKEYERTNDPFCKRIILLIDECAELLDPTGRTKDERELIAQIAAHLNTIARMGRAVGIHLIISTQRPDMNAVPGSLKSNLDVRICGKADPTLSTIILGDGRADELIPKYSQGRFVMADGAQDIVFQGFYYDRKR